MWRDILIILAFVLTALAYFGITPRRILGYTRAVKGEVAKRGLFERIFLLTMIIQSVVVIGEVIYKIGTVSFVLFIFATQNFIWYGALHDVWQLSEKGNKILGRVCLSVAISLFIAAIIFTDMRLWQKIVYPIGGFCIGFCIYRLISYIDSKRKRKQALKK